MKKQNKYLARLERLGLPGFLRYLFYKKLGLAFGDGFFLHTKRVEHPLYCRKGSTDIDVFKHIYVVDEYQKIEADDDAELVVDCGANAGFSTVFLLNRFPSAKVVAIEPDGGNFATLLRNTHSYGERCVTMKAGVWPKSCGLDVVDSEVGDGREWARGVRPAREGEIADIEALSIPALLKQFPGKRISLLKIDIEGTEEVLFSEGEMAWLESVDRIVIELHGKACEKAYLEAVTRAGFESHEEGGLTFSRRKSGVR